MNSPWVWLTRASGLSGKAAGAGGSYGIGQNAPFAASDLRTVLYSTSTGNNRCRFLGVAKLVTHEVDGQRRHWRGYLGGPQGVSVTGRRRIPRQFLRSKKGTDLFILGFKNEGDWERQLEISVLDNFWPAIHQGHLVVRIGQQKIDSRNLTERLRALDHSTESDAYQYYLTYTDPHLDEKKELGEIGTCIYRARIGDDLSPRKVAMIRLSGMVIYRRDFRFGIPYCGVFHCIDKTGNEVLRRMEPPAHDKWDKNLPQRGEHARVDRAIRDFVRGCMTEYQSAMEDDDLELDELDDFLPDEEPNPEEGAYPNETFPDGFQKDSSKKTLPVDTIRRKASPAPGMGQEEGGGPSGGEEGRGGGEGGSGAGSGGTGNQSPVPVSYRAFPIDTNGAKYSIRVRANTDGERQIYLTLRASGDDILEPLPVVEARVSRGSRIRISNDGKRIGPVELRATRTLSLEVTLKHPMTVAVEVSAYETGD